MSLKVWLPLTGNLDNLGVSDFTLSNHNATVSNSGKIGQCYYFNGSQQWLQFSHSFGDFYNNDWSFCVWLKPTDSTRSVILSEYNGTGSSNVAIELTTARVVRLYWNGTPDVNFTTAGALPINEWTHLTITKQGSVFNVYFNGVLKQTYTYSGTLSTRTSNCQPRIGDDYRGDSGSTVSYQGYLNDFRLYDHCLSVKEIQEICRALVIHYKLDDIIGRNLAIDTPKTITPTAYCACQIALSENLVAGETYTLQLWDVNVYHSEKTEAQTGVWIYWGGGSVTLGNWAGSTYFTNGHADYLSTTFTVTSSQASGSGATNAWFNMYNSVGYVAGTMNMTIGKWQLVKGDTELAYVHYSPLSYVPDSSGFGNNGKINSTLTLSSDTTDGRYANCASFDGVNDCIILPYNKVCPDNIFTSNIWFKKDTIGTKNYESLWGGPSGFEMDTRAGSATTLSLYMASVRGGNLYSPLPFGEWTMITMSRDGTNEKYYVNGELVKTIEAKSMPTGTYYVGAWSTAAGQNFYGLLSDFRLYNTVLSDDDIKELYNNPANIDNSGGYHGFELVEDTSTEELMGAAVLTSPWSTKLNNNDGSKFATKEGLYFDTNSSIGSPYIKINPSGKTYYFDTVISVSAGNQFYIGFERYDANKTSRSNNACVYPIAIKPTSDLTYARYSSVVDLSTDGVNPTDTISLRILNKWSGSDANTEGKATVHYLSLREIPTSTGAKNSQIYKNGVTSVDTIMQLDNGKSFEKIGIANFNDFIEK